MAQLSPTTSVALKPKCPSGSGRAMWNRALRREYHGLEGCRVEKPVWRRVKFPPCCYPQVRVPCTVPRGDTAWLEQLCWEGAGQFSPLCPIMGTIPAHPECITAGKGQWRYKEQKPVSISVLCARGYTVPCWVKDAHVVMAEDGLCR